MAWHHGTFSCGHEGRVNIVGPIKNRDWIAERKFEGKCPECYEIYLLEQREKANTEAAEKAIEMDLPELQGTEKQVAWANTLRQKLMDKFEVLDEMHFKIAKKQYDELSVLNLSFDDLKLIELSILENKTDAKYYIDSRDENIYYFILKEIKNTVNEIREEEIIERNIELEIKAESIVKPVDAITNVAVEITICENKIIVKFEKNDKFREIVKSLSFGWSDGAWRRTTNSLTGTSEDRAAELGNKLLNAGFPIMIMDETVRNNAVNGTYEAECNRWIKLRTKGEHAGRIAIRWWEDNDRLYKTARKLPGSRWDSPYVTVKIEHYKEIQEFAKMYEFKFTEIALKSIEEYKLAMGKVEIVNPVVVTEEKTKDGLQEILNSGSDILDDLKD